VVGIHRQQFVGPISVTFSPKTQGAKSGTVTINDSASSKPQVIELSGTGT
jgi:hypothetical protein